MEVDSENVAFETDGADYSREAASDHFRGLYISQTARESLVGPSDIAPEQTDDEATYVTPPVKTSLCTYASRQGLALLAVEASTLVTRSIPRYWPPNQARILAWLPWASSK